MATDKLKIGSAAPEFELKGIDNKYYSLNDFSERKGLVIIFFCNHCPYVQAYIERIKELQKDYNDKGITIIAINPNDSKRYPEDSFDEMQKKGKELEFNFIYLHDESQEIAKKYGSTHTPEIFLLNENRVLVFHGKIDDNWKEPEAVKEHYLKIAIEEMLSNKEISVPETFTVGCTIKWKE